MEKKNKILVTGAGGFIGKVVVEKLIVEGWHVKAMVRKATKLPCKNQEKLEIVYADMRNTSSLRKAVQNASVIVHLAAAKADEIDSEDINVEGAKRLVAECKGSGCERIINISSQSAKITRKGIYARTKFKADKIFHNSELKVTTLMPSIVYGDEESGVFGTVVRFAMKLPLIPVLGNGKWVSAPVYVKDVSAAIVSCIKNDVTIGKKYDIGGPDFISFDKLIDKICGELNLKRLKIHIPFFLSLLAAKILAAIVPKPPITVSNVLGSNQDTNIDISPACKDFGYDPINLETGLKATLGNVQNLLNQNVTENNESIKRFNVREKLKAESILITKYLIGYVPPKKLIDRYIGANRTLFNDRNQWVENSELNFIHRHPFCLPFIDAAAGLMSPNSIVRKKIFLMSAILEATPTFAHFFLRKPEPVLKLIGIIGWQGLRSLIKIIFGIPIFMLVRRGHG